RTGDDNPLTKPLIVEISISPLVYPPEAGDGNRTHTTSLEGWSSTIELRPQSTSFESNPTSRPVPPQTNSFAIPLPVQFHWGLCHVNFTEVSSGQRCRSGGRRIRTFEGYATRFTVWPL